MIQTTRLRLGRHRQVDVEPRIAMTSEPVVTRFLGGPQTPEENCNLLQRRAGHWTPLDHGILVVEERASGRYAGEVGLCAFRRDLGSDFDGAPEAAWMIASWAAGQGFASEAMVALVAWHEERFGTGRKVCVVDPDNLASLRVAWKLGFRSFRENFYKDHRVILHERPRAPPQAG